MRKEWVNLNAAVSVRLTPAGEATLIAYDCMYVAGTDSWHGTLWECMRIFGPGLEMVADIPFINNEIELTVAS